MSVKVSIWTTASVNAKCCSKELGLCVSLAVISHSEPRVEDLLSPLWAMCVVEFPGRARAVSL